MKEIKIFSERLLIRNFEKNDFRNFCKVNMDREIMKYFEGGAKTLEQARRRFSEIMEHQEKYGFSYWGIFLKDSQEFLGQCGLYYNYDMSLNLCYGFLENFHGKGYAFEACSTILDYMFKNYSFKYVTAMSHIENNSSIKLINRLGFKKTGEKTLYSGVQVFLFSLSREEFYNKIKIVNI